MTQIKTVEDIFKKVAERENATLRIHDKDIHIGGGVRSPRVIYLLTLDYKGHTIQIKNEKGTGFAGHITCNIKTTGKPIEFQITTKSHLSKLFRSKKNRFKIITENINTRLFLERSNALEALEVFARKDVFEPLIAGSYEGNLFVLESKYHLQFSDWTGVLEPFISFYKSFIDAFSERIY